MTMIRRLELGLLLLLTCAGTAWAKMKKEEQDYLDSKIAQVTSQMGAQQEQIRALKAQVETLGKQLTDLQKAQGEFREATVREQQYLSDMSQSVLMMRQSHETNFGTVVSALNVLINGMRKMQNAYSTAAAAGTAEVVPPPGSGVAGLATPSDTVAPPSPKSVGYITDAGGEVLTIGLGSAQGLHVGSKLGVYKSSDLNARVGQLEITEIVDANNSHARVVTMNPGIRPDFSDTVRLE